MNISIYYDLLRGVLDDANDRFPFIFNYAEILYHKISDYVSVQKLLPPLIMLTAVYLTILSLYRTTTFLIRTTLFFVKWGGLIAIIAAAVGYFAKDSFSFTSSKSQKHRASKPRVWDTFAEHQRWRNDESRSKEITDTIYEIIGEVTDAAQQLVRQGWQQTLLRLTAGEQNSPRKSSKSAKGKSRSR